MSGGRLLECTCVEWSWRTFVHSYVHYELNANSMNTNNVTAIATPEEDGGGNMTQHI